MRDWARATAVLAVCVIAAGCGVGAADGGEGALAPVETVRVLDDGVVKVRITSDDNMRFSTDRFTVPAGQPVRLRLDHVGRMSLHRMGHNVVIVEPGADPVRMGAEILGSGGSLDNHYVTDAVRDRVIAYTPMIGGGDSVTVEFTAPGPGEYPFFCSFPGHFGVMTGVMVVTE